MALVTTPAGTSYVNLAHILEDRDRRLGCRAPRLPVCRLAQCLTSPSFASTAKLSALRVRARRPTRTLIEHEDALLRVVDVSRLGTRTRSSSPCSSSSNLN